MKTLHELLNGMSVELADKVHLLFMANYIDYSGYDFRDENQVENYCWCYRDLFELKTKESQEIVSNQVIEFLDEWRQDAPSRYRKAKDDICYWITDEWYSFESPMQKEIETAYQTALEKRDSSLGRLLFFAKFFVIFRVFCLVEKRNLLNLQTVKGE